MRKETIAVDVPANPAIADIVTFKVRIDDLQEAARLSVDANELLVFVRASEPVRAALHLITLAPVFVLHAVLKRGGVANTVELMSDNDAYRVTNSKTRQSIKMTSTAFGVVVAELLDVAKGEGEATWKTLVDKGAFTATSEAGSA
jgi:hypothetical protein